MTNKVGNKLSMSDKVNVFLDDPINTSVLSPPSVNVPMTP